MGRNRVVVGASEVQEKDRKEVFVGGEMKDDGTAVVGSKLGTEIVMPRGGRPEVLEVRRRDLSAPEPGQVVVRVEAAGVAFSEVQMLKGRYFGQPKFPFVPGYDLVGEVESVGEGVDDALLGTRVAALTQTGAWADRVTLDVKELASVPGGLDPAEAVAAITNGVTAWQMIHRAARVRPGQSVLVHGASGGVGTLLVQLARLVGAEVIGTASNSKHEYVRALGAVPVDYKNEDVPKRVREISPGGVDVVFDHVGGPGLVDSWRMLRRGGTLVTYGSASTLNGSGHWLKPYLPLMGRVLLWSVLPNGKRAAFYLICVAVGSVTGLVAGIVAVSGLLAQAGFIILVVFWAYSATMAYASIRNGHVQLHRIWMIRNFALTFAAVWLRIVILVGQTFFSSVPFDKVYNLAIWSSILCPLVLAEWFIVQRTLRPLALKQHQS